MRAKQYLIHYVQQHVPFRVPEFESLTAMFKLNFEYLDAPSDSRPYLLVETDDEELLKRTCARSSLVRSLIELWGRGTTMDSFKASVLSSGYAHEEEFISEDKSFSILVKPFGKCYKRDEIIRRINGLQFIGFRGSVSINNPTNCFHLIEYYGSPEDPIEEKPREIFFGRFLCGGSRDAIEFLSLKKRKFISTTSMDAHLALIMANMAQVDHTKLVFDPFVGTGSVTVAAAYYGAHALGADIDWPLLHGRSKPTRCGIAKRDPDENVQGMFASYGLADKYVDVLLADAAMFHYSDKIRFDAIITDPPYGIREGSEKVGRSSRHAAPNEGHSHEVHYPAKTLYNLADVVGDLLDFSRRRLVPGTGRLVFWIPIFIGKSQQQPFGDLSTAKLTASLIDEQIPRHPAFELKSFSIQPLTAAYCRVLIVMQLKSSDDDRLCSIENGDGDNNDDHPLPESLKNFRSKILQPKHYREVPI